MVPQLVNWMTAFVGRRSAQNGQLFVPKDDAVTVLQPAYTLRLRPEEGSEGEPKAAGSEETKGAPFFLAWHGLTDRGKLREGNEDAYSHLSLPGKDLFAVADGMGGHDAGETASRIAVETLCESIRTREDWEGRPQEILEEAIHRANSAVKRAGEEQRSDMGSTLTAALIVDGSAYIANVGDSRAYWIENSSLRQITRDHSLVARLVGAGKLTKDDARNDPRSNLLYRCIGNEENIVVDIFQQDLKKGGMLLLCTDGLWGEVADDDLQRICASAKNCDAICEELIRTANESGGKDNITAIVVKVSQ